jgi:hypothetical protein
MAFTGSDGHSYSEGYTRIRFHKHRIFLIQESPYNSFIKK